MKLLKAFKSWGRRQPPAPAPARAKLEPVQTISERELNARFAAAPGSPLWEATLAVIEQRILAGLDDAVDERLDDRGARWRLGGVEALIALRDELRERERAAREEGQGNETAETR